MKVITDARWQENYGGRTITTTTINKNRILHKEFLLEKLVIDIENYLKKISKHSKNKLFFSCFIKLVIEYVFYIETSSVAKMFFYKLMFNF